MDRKDALKRTSVLLGGIIFAPNILGILKGCTPVDEPWLPVLFNRKQASLVRALADIILPSVDGPGAVDVGVPGFIEKMVNEVYNQQQRDFFLSGLDLFDNRCKKSTGITFVKLKPDEQHTYVHKQNRLAIENEKVEGPQFFLLFKELTLVGFFTSETGATQVLRYEHIPGYYDGCVPFKEIGRTWATG
jgi:gluconate 2-dehydrogenase gamma chain